MMGESPTRPQRLACVPPVEVPAAIFPCGSSAATPTVPYLCTSGDSTSANGALGSGGAPTGRGGIGSPSFLSCLISDCQRRSVKKKLGSTCSRADQKNVRRFFHHCTGQADGMPRARYIGDGARLECRAVHNCCIELVGSICCEHGSMAGVEVRIVFENANRGLDGIERRSAALQHLFACFDRGLHPCPVFSFPLGRHRLALDNAGATMHHDRPPMALLLRAHRLRTRRLLRSCCRRAHYHSHTGSRTDRSQNRYWPDYSRQLHPSSHCKTAHDRESRDACTGIQSPVLTGNSTCDRALAE